MKTQKLWYFLLALCIIISSFVFACNSPAETPAPTTTPTPTPATTPPPTTTPTPTQTPTTSPTPTSTPATTTPQYGGTLKLIANYGWTDNLGYPPMTPPSFTPFVPAPAIESLLRADPTTGLPTPYLITGWEWADDYNSIVLTLRQGVKFHDGTDFNAQSVKYMLDIQKSITADLGEVTSIDVINDYTLRFNTKRYSNSLLYDLVCKAGAAGAISATSVKTHGPDWSLTNAVSTGPFKQTSFQRSVGIRYEKFDGYWQEGKPYLDAVDVSFITDPVTAKLSFMAGEGNVVAGITSLDAQELAATGKYDVTAYPTRVNVLAPDSINPDSIFSKLEVRQAIAYAIDVESLVEVHGNGMITYTNQVLYPNSIGYNPNVVGYPYNPAKAKQLLAEAGYPDGFDTTIYFQSGLGYDNAALIAQRYLSDVGINAELQPIGSARRAELIYNGWPTSSMMLYGAYLTAGNTSVKTFVNCYSQSSLAFASLQRPDDVQAALDKALGELDQDKFISYLQEVSAGIIDTHCLVIPLFMDIVVGARDKSIQDSYILDPTNENWTPEVTWIKK